VPDPNGGASLKKSYTEPINRSIQKPEVNNENAIDNITMKHGQRADVRTEDNGGKLHRIP
jgi:hypothetical protein